MNWIKAFLAGFLATLFFHQGLFTVFYLAGAVPVAPFNLTAVPPFGVPAVVSLAFFGGVWGMVLWALAARFTDWKYWLTNIIAGAIGPTAVAMIIVFPLKDLDVSSRTWIGGLVLNGFWGFGVGIFMTLFGGRSTGQNDSNQDKKDRT